MNGKVNTLVGETGAGKGSFVKGKLKISKRKKYAYVRIKKDFPDDVEQFTDFDLFLEKINTVKDSIIIIDEAFTILPNKINQNKKRDRDLITFLVNARKLNNFVFIIYHAFNQVPIWVISYSDFFIRFNTNDQLQFQRNRFLSYPLIVASIDSYNKIPKFEFDEIKIR